MRIVQLNLAIAFILATGCGSKGETHWSGSFVKKTPFRSESESYPIDFMQIYKKIMAHSMADDISGREPGLAIDVVYGEVLNIDFKNLQKANISEYQISMLPVISEKRLQNIIQQIPAKLQKTGFEVFSPNYWKLLKSTIDAKEVKVGALHFSTASSIDGVYSHNQLLIGVDALAVVGTLEHELRHHNQHVVVQPLPSYLEGLECFAYLSTAMGETDAASYDMKYWQGVFESLDINELKNDFKDSDDPMFPQAYYFNVSVDYPQKVLKDLLSSKTCSDSVNSVMENLLNTIQPQVEVLKSRVEDIVSLISENLFEYKLIGANVCIENTAIDPACARIADNKQRIEEVKKQFSAELAFASQNRYAKTSDVLKQLPKAVQYLMKTYIPGALFLMEEGWESQ